MGIKAPAIPAPPPPPPMLASSLLQNQKQLQSAANGPYTAGGTILTGPQGLGAGAVATAGKALTGA